MLLFVVAGYKNFWQETKGNFKTAVSKHLPELQEKALL